MRVIRGTSDKYLDINLTTRKWSVYNVSEQDRVSYIGGKGLGMKIFNDRFVGTLAQVDPLGEENLLIFSMGVMLSTGVPCSGRFEIITRSPLTNLMLASSCGGLFGEACKTAGWDGVIITGRSDRPVLVRIDEEGVEFEDAENLWGQGTGEVQSSLNLGPREGAAVIGPAGENLVRYASICSGHRFAGRGGAGAVMGAKNLKAVVARGRSVKYEPVLPKRFKENDKKAKTFIIRNNMTKGFMAYGTNVNVRYGIKAGFSPVRNFRDRYNPETERTSGEAMAERYSTRHSTCRHCTVLCGHKGRYPDGVMRQIPEYETTGMFGSNIENYDPDLIGRWNDIMNELGLDTISTGGTIAWAMEAAEKGLRKSELAFGRTDNIDTILKDIAYKTGEGKELAEGSMRLSRVYGGTEFAIHVKGLECAAYDPRASWGQGLSYAVYNKGGCHLGSYLVGLERLMGYMPPLTTLGKADWVIFLEDLFTGINSLQVCLFTVFGILVEPVIPKYLPRSVLKIATISMPKIAMALMNWSILSNYFWFMTGIKMDKWDFLKAGRRINMLERWMNVRMGLKASDDTLPERFTKEKETLYPGKNTVVPIEKMVQQYHTKRGYGPDGGPLSAALSDNGKRKNLHVKPSGRLVKNLYCTVIMAVLQWFIPNIACRKAAVREDIAKLPQGVTCRFGVWPTGPAFTLRREGDRLKAVKGGRAGVDLGVYLKTLDAAWLLFTFQESTCGSEAAGRLMVRGELPHTCTFIRIMDKVEILLLPRFIAKKAVKKWEKVR